MHQQFPSWYIECNPEPSEELLEKRWAGVSFLSTNPSPDDIAGLVLMAFGDDAVNSTFTESFKSAFVEHDKAYAATNAEVESAVLAAAVLSNVMSDMETWSGIHASLSTLAYFFNGKRTSDHGRWLTAFAESAKKRKSLELRLQREQSTPPTTLGPFKADELDELKTAEDWKVCVDKLFEYLNKTLNALNGVSSQLHDKLLAFEQAQSLYEEELDIVWWLFSGMSRDCEARFDTLDVKSLALVVGKELADLVRVLPGPCAATAFLEAALQHSSSAGQIQLQTAVNQADGGWKQSVISSVDLGSLWTFCPIHSAIAKSIESDSWSDAFTHVTSLSPTMRVKAQDISKQFYLERLLLRSDSLQSMEA